MLNQIMKKYKVLVEGNNYEVCLDGNTSKYGFFTTRFIETKNSGEAEIVAMDLIRDELKEIAMNDIVDPPTIYVEETQEIDDFGDNIVPGSGFTWFESEETMH